MDDDPFGYPIAHYAWAIGIACVGGIVKHINSAKKINVAKFAVDIVTSGFTGVMTFWFCQSANIHGPLSAILIATGGMMGNRAWKEFENFWRAKIGLPLERRADDRRSNVKDDEEDEDKP